MAAGLEETFGGGGYTALQGSALLNLAWDHISSGLDGRESAFELHVNGGIPTWRNRLRRWFSDYNELANGVVKSLDLDMPVIDLDSLRQMFLAPRRPVSVLSQEGSAARPQQGA
jgi:4-hydroxyphenylacetate 3-monooxygenase